MSVCLCIFVAGVYIAHNPKYLPWKPFDVNNDHKILTKITRSRLSATGLQVS